MTAEQLLDAIGDINSVAIRDAKFRQKPRKSYKKKVVTVLIAAVLILAMGVTAFAYFGSGEWFKAFFTGRSKEKLTKPQQQYIDDSVFGIGETAQCGGWAVTVEAAICDKYHAFIKLNIEAPEGTEFKDGVYSFEDVRFGKTEPKETEKISAGGYSFSLAENESGRKNSLTLLFESVITVDEFNNFSYTDGAERELSIKKFSFIDENGEKHILADGEWYFRFKLKETDDNTDEELEFITEPVNTFGKGLQREEVKARLLSCRVSPMGITCMLDFPAEETPEAIELQNVCVFMKDGCCIKPLPGACGLNCYTKVCTLNLNFDAPVLLEEIDYIELPQNVKLFGCTQR